MIEHRFYDFQDDLIEKVLQDHPKERAVFIFPTERSKKETLRLFQQSSDFSDNIFLTMEEFKECLFVDDLPLLREERRNIALYYSLSPEHKRDLKIQNYFQFISFAGDFFSFWEEFSEEQVDIENCLEVLENLGEDVLDWQRKTYVMLCEIRESYRLYLGKKGWTDKIFLIDDTKVIFDYFRDKKRFVFINQHYYTRLENRLLNMLEEENFEITVCYQLPESLVDKEKNCLIEHPLFPISDLNDHLTEKIEIFTAQNDFSMYQRFLDILQTTEDLKNAFDSKFYRSSYPRFLSPSHFSGVDNEPLINSRVSLFLTSLVELLDSIIIEHTKKNELIPIVVLKKLLSEDVFYRYFEQDLSNQDKILAILDFYLRENYCYLDLNLNCLIVFKKSKTEINIEVFKTFLHKIFSLLNRLVEVRSIKDFIASIDTEQGFQLNSLISEDERTFSDLPETFYKSLADFANIEDLGIINNEIFWNEGQKRTRFTDCLSILKLMLLYMRPKRYKLYYHRDKRQIEISSLMDSRNLSFEKVAVLNVTEGVLPAGRSTPFLFTESQRKKLGLKTYEDIRLWEKYYFFRLLLNSRHVYLFAQRNVNINNEVSSFIEELRLMFSNEKRANSLENVIEIKEEIVPDQGYEEFYRQVIQPDDKYLPDRTLIKDPHFYIIPYHKENDREHNKLVLSYSSYKILHNSPFSYYLKYLGIIDEEVIYKPLSPLLIGTIAHEIIDKIWHIVQIPSEEDLTEFFENLPIKVSGILEQLSNHILNSEELYYKIPHTYSYRYFKEIFLPIVEDGIESFFFLLQDIIKHKNSRFNKEPEKWGDKCKFPLPMGIDLDLNLRGKGDLVVTEYDLDNQQEFFKIFDYKTGFLSDSKELVTQLIFYELLFYYLKKDKSTTLPELVESISESDKIRSYMYSLTDKKMKELNEFYSRKTKKELFCEFINTLIIVLQNILDSGYAGIRSRSSLCLFPEIVRTDLLKKNISIDSFTADKGGI
ncbi:MAG: PD-(D/E)XK nuclease family protein [Candidatus Cloacimonetes bacterium]|nr:PD-(D/E)XK nuclease family protein [Candidatus Cloacimonadota bacterium]